MMAKVPLLAGVVSSRFVLYLLSGRGGASGPALTHGQARRHGREEGERGEKHRGSGESRDDARLQTRTAPDSTGRIPSRATKRTTLLAVVRSTLEVRSSPFAFTRLRVRWPRRQAWTAKGASQRSASSMPPTAKVHSVSI